jgi:hypothetical protein
MLTVISSRLHFVHIEASVELTGELSTPLPRQFTRRRCRAHCRSSQTDWLRISILVTARHRPASAMPTVHSMLHRSAAPAIARWSVDLTSFASDHVVIRLPRPFTGPLHLHSPPVHLDKWQRFSPAPSQLADVLGTVTAAERVLVAAASGACTPDLPPCVTQTPPHWSPQC